MNISVTKQFLTLLALGLVLLMPAAFSGVSYLFFYAYNIICFGLLLVDFIISPGPDVLEVQRPTEDTLYFKSDQAVSVFVRNIFHKNMWVEVKDEIPDWHFEVTPTDTQGIVESQTQKTFTYHITPTKRGSFLFPRVHVRYRGVLGLCVKYFAADKPINYKVYPHLEDLSAYRLATQKNRQLETGRKRISLQDFSIGAEFESLREYVIGDDYRKINWMASARGAKLVVNQYEAEKNQPVFILMDTSRPMGYSVKGYRKLDYAINAALILADIVNQNGDNSGLMVFDTEVNTIIMPGKGQAHRSTLMEKLYHVTPTKNTANYDGACTTLITRQKRRGLVFVFTDFETMEEANALASSMKLLAKRHRPIIVLIKDEKLVRRAEHIKDINEVYENAMLLDFLEERKNIIRHLNANGIFCVESQSERFALDTVNYYLRLKEPLAK